MYCPKCGQHVSDNMRFCSRCGLPLSEVSEWLAGGGGGLAVREETQLAVLSPRRKAMRRGAKTMFWGGILLPISMILSIVVDAPLPLIIPFLTFLAGLSMWLYSRLFGEEISFNRSRQAQEMRLGTGPENRALPPGSDAGFISGGRQEVRTAEMAQPPSVTEHTTKLLDHE
jgi:hypothetical protein